MEFQYALKPEFTSKDLNFINDFSLRRILRKRLEELDQILFIGATYSTIFLSISTIEGIFRHIAGLFISEEEKKNEWYPKTSDGNPKDWDYLTIDELYKILKEGLKIISAEEDLSKTIETLRKYRNFIHPQLEIKKNWTISIGHAQMALGLLNASINYFSDYLFVGKEKLLRIAGNPDYHSKALSLEFSNNPLVSSYSHFNPFNSFVIFEKSISKKTTIKFNLDLQKESLLNFIFNFRDESNFMMFRLDKREKFSNMLLESKQRHHWVKICDIEPATLPKESEFSVQITLDPNNYPEVIVGEGEMKFEPTSISNGSELLSSYKIQPDSQFGFFNEVGPVTISNLTITEE